MTAVWSSVIIDAMAVSCRHEEHSECPTALTATCSSPNSAARGECAARDAQPQRGDDGCQAGVPSSHWLSVNCWTFVPSERMTKISP